MKAIPTPRHRERHRGRCVPTQPMSEGAAGVTAAEDHPANDDPPSTGGNYEVGYGRPPTHTRFKPGQSGNPKGRPKGAKNFATDLAEVLAEHVPITEGGKKRRVTKQRAVVLATVARAARGEPAAVGRLIQLMLTYLTSDPASDEGGALSKEDAGVLEAYVTRQIRKRQRQGGTE